MASSNYDDILGQLQKAGLIVDTLIVGRLVRCKVEGDREKRAWYTLHEIITAKGDQLLVGSYGIWRGNDQGTIKLDVRKSDFSAEQRELLRERIREDRRRADEAQKRNEFKAAQRAQAAWLKCTNEGESEYLTRKGVGAYGVRFSPSGAVVIPMIDTAGVIHGLQVIRTRHEAKEKGLREKDFWPAGVAKKGHFHLIGTPTWIVLLAEGYATGASLHAATGLPVAIAFDAGNLGPVAKELHHRYRSAKILVCADDDAFAKCDAKPVACDTRIVLTENYQACPGCGQEHRRVNTGVFTSSTVGVAVSGSFVMPRFADEPGRRAKFLERGIKITDFNDLYLLEGLHAVRVQIETRITELGWHALARRAPTSTAAGEGRPTLRPIETLGELLDRFVLVYGMKGTVFDRVEHRLVALTDMRDICVTRDLHKAWCEHAERAIARDEEVGFDPGGKDLKVTCNLYSGWPTKPAKGSCDNLLKLLRYMCSKETNADRLYNWLLRWIAYPIKVPGAKMKSCVVVHGPQGTGKNLFFEAVMAIYGRYGATIDQDAIEDKFNDYASAKLFLIADEVVAHHERYHVKNKLKGFVTGDYIRINPKNFGAYWERNHVNLVFLSNESMPVVLEDDDRRHAILWTPAALSAEFYLDVAAELRNGGVEALHEYLLTEVDLSDFSEHAKPPMSDAKLKLLDLSMDNVSRFLFELSDGDIPGLRAMPALSRQIYGVYKAWCTNNGYRAAPINKMLNIFERKHSITVERMRYIDPIMHTTVGPLSICLLGGAVSGECPPGKERAMWLGECIAAFDALLSDTRNAA